MTGKESYLDSVSQRNIGFIYDLVNQLWVMGSKIYTNDSTRNQIGKTNTDAWNYIYDGESRSTQVIKNGVDLLDNTNDGSGMRAKEVKNGQTTYFVYQGNNPLMEYSLNDNKYKYFIYAGNKLVAEEKEGVVNYYHTDHLGSTRLVTDASGNKVAEYKFKPYEETENYSGTFSTNYQFTGKPVNAEVGLAYFGGRFYDPEIGRFITLDPGRQGLNWYSYCGNNPIKNVDPDGCWFDTAVDVVSFGVSLNDLRRDPRNVWNWVSAGADVACILLPFAAGGGLAVKALTKADDAIDTGKALANARKLGKAGEDLAGIVAKKTRIDSITGTAKFRIPDELTGTALREIKN